MHGLLLSGRGRCSNRSSRRQREKKKARISHEESHALPCTCWPCIVVTWADGLWAGQRTGVSGCHSGGVAVVYLPSAILRLTDVRSVNSCSSPDCRRQIVDARLSSPDRVRMDSVGDTRIRMRRSHAVQSTPAMMLQTCEVVWATGKSNGSVFYTWGDKREELQRVTSAVVCEPLSSRKDQCSCLQTRRCKALMQSAELANGPAVVPFRERLHPHATSIYSVFTYGVLKLLSNTEYLRGCLFISAWQMISFTEWTGQY